MCSKLVMLVAVMLMGISLTEGIDRGSKCVFPFKYKDDWYHGCTTKDKNSPWCATAEIYSERKWKWCVYEAGNLTDVKTYSGSTCKFPFSYNGAFYYGCTSLDHPRHKSWCLDTTQQFKHSIQDLCVVERNQEVSTFGGSSNGEPCHFPFFYRGVQYNGCTNDDYSRRDGKYFCGVKQNTKVPKADSITWGYCNVIDTVEHTGDLVFYTNKAWKDTTCVFPFTYKGQKQHGCIGGNPWCATTNNYDNDGKWKYCDNNDYMATADILRDQTTEIRKQPQCSWPFVRDGMLANKDMDVYPEGDANSRSYCSTTHNYDIDQKKKLSGRGGYNSKFNSKCYFPFLYQDTVHHTCWNGWSLWCKTGNGFFEKRQLARTSWIRYKHKSTWEWVKCYG